MRIAVDEDECWGDWALGKTEDREVAEGEGWGGKAVGKAAFEYVGEERG